MAPEKTTFPCKRGKCALNPKHPPKKIWIERTQSHHLATRNALDETVIRCCLQRYRHEEFIRFNTVEPQIPEDKMIEAVVDNYPLQRLRPQAPEGQSLAGTPSTVDVSLHTHLRLMAERGRELLLCAYPKAYSARHLPLAGLLAGSRQALARRAQQRPKAVRVDRVNRLHPGQTRPAACVMCLSRNTNPSSSHRNCSLFRRS